MHTTFTNFTNDSVRKVIKGTIAFLANAGSTGSAKPTEETQNSQITELSCDAHYYFTPRIKYPHQKSNAKHKQRYGGRITWRLGNAAWTGRFPGVLPEGSVHTLTAQLEKSSN